MEGLYVRFKETDHPIWIGTHKYGMVKSGPNSMSSASLRKLYTVGDAITSFKTAVAPDVDGSSITLHFEPSRESISSDCLLAAIQLENSFEKGSKYDASLRCANARCLLQKPDCEHVLKSSTFTIHADCIKKSQKTKKFICLL